MKRKLCAPRIVNASVSGVQFPNDDKKNKISETKLVLEIINEF